MTLKILDTRLAIWQRFLMVLLLGLSSFCVAGDGKLLGTGGLLSVEGSAGGGITPWASLASYAEDQQIGATAGYSQVRLDDYDLQSTAVGVGFYNRLELTVAEQRFDFAKSPLALGQRIYGAKLRLLGDPVYAAGQLSLGVAHKVSTKRSTLSALGIGDDRDTDYYLSAAKLWLYGPFGRNFLLNGTLRNSAAQQTGLLGFSDRRRWQLEVASALLLNRKLALGIEYRSKPDQIPGLPEDDWKDLFLAYFPNKNLSVALAYVDLGRIGGKPKQNGFYLTVQGLF